MNTKIVSFGLVSALVLSVGMASALSNSNGGEWHYYNENTIKEKSGKALSDYSYFINRGDLSEEQLISYINQVKEGLAEDPSINISVTSAGVHGVLLSHPNVISTVDLVFANYGAYWRIWDKKGNLKPGMQDIFDGKTIVNNWSAPSPEEPIIDFPALPELTQTNIPTFVVAGSTEIDNEVWLNRKALPNDAMDEEGNFAVAVPLFEGDNLLELVIKTGEEVITTVEKTVHFNEGFSTGGNRLIYVDSVAIGEGVPALPGTIVINLDNDALLGLIEDKHVVGISPDGSEIYTSDKTVISTDTHRELRILPFTLDIPSNGFVVSPDGTRLYSRNERIDVTSNTLLENLPINIVTGSSFAGAPIPGGPTISDNGRYIYCCNNIVIIDTKEYTVIKTGISGHFMSDIAFTPDESKILVSEYSYGRGRLDVYDSDTFELLATISDMGDFTGEIAFSKDGQRAIVGSAGNPAWPTDGRVTVIDLKELKRVFQKTVPLVDNLAMSENNEFFVSSGESDLYDRLGIDVYVLEPSGNLVRTKTFFLGINGFKKSTGKPKDDQIRRIVFKPKVSPIEIFDTGNPANRYPSLFGTHTGKIKPNHEIIVNKMYTYSCSGTGGHSKYIRIYGNGLDVNGTWNGYRGADDYHYIEFSASFTLEANVTYYYTIHTGSYPQIHHNTTLIVPDGEITCAEFKDANQNIYHDWIPAIRLE